MLTVQAEADVVDLCETACDVAADVLGLTDDEVQAMCWHAFLFWGNFWRLRNLDENPWMQVQDAFDKIRVERQESPRPGNLEQLGTARSQWVIACLRLDGPLSLMPGSAPIYMANLAPVELNHPALKLAEELPKPNKAEALQACRWQG